MTDSTAQGAGDQDRTVWSVQTSAATSDPSTDTARQCADRLAWLERLKALVGDTPPHIRALPSRLNRIAR